MRSLTTCQPTSRTLAFDRDLDRLFTGFFGPSVFTHSGEWRPAADVEQKEDAYLVRLDLPGVRREDIKVSVDDGHLLVEGTRTTEQSDSGDGFLRQERVTGSFRRSFRLGTQVDAGKIDAHFENGVLEIRVAKAEEARSRLIEVR